VENDCHTASLTPNFDIVHAWSKHSFGGKYLYFYKSIWS